MNTSAIPIVNERHEFTFIEIINRAFWISGDDSFRISGDDNGIDADIAFVAIGHTAGAPLAVKNWRRRR